MENVYVTLFDHKYLSRGLNLYESIHRVCKDFRLYIIAFDEECFSFLNEARLNKTTIIPLSDFEDEELLRVKESRSVGEYCWTSTPKSVQYIFDHFQEKICTYIDSDLFFYSDPSILIDEMPDNKSVMITEHRYSDYCDQTSTSGIYNVQFVTFRNNEEARGVLDWWAARCIENCCMDFEHGICGDQKYLDDWLERFDCVYVLQNYGAGIGPWNVDQYSFKRKNNKVVFKIDVLQDKRVVFYHFHALEFYDKGVVGLTGRQYRIPDTAVAHIYKLYIRNHIEVVRKYSVSSDCIYQKHFRDDDIDHLRHDKNYYLLDIFR